MDPNVEYVDELKADEGRLFATRAGSTRRGVGRSFLQGAGAGSSWATAKYQQAIVLGIDDASMVGAPRKMVLGSLANCVSPTRSSWMRMATNIFGRTNRCALADCWR